MDVAIIIAIISGVIAIVNSYQLHNSKLSRASEKKISAEADHIIYDLKNQIIQDLQSQIDELKVEIRLLKNQEFIYFEEKIRMESLIKDLKTQNDELKKTLITSHEQIDKLTKQIDNMRMELNAFKTKHRIDEKNISDSRTS